MMLQPELTIIISTINNGINGLKNTIKFKNDCTRYLIIFQNLQGIPIPEFLKRDDIEVIEIFTKGLSKSRNIGIDNCKTKYAIIADDDVKYFDNTFDIVIKTFQRTGADVLSFKIQTESNEPEYKKYIDEDGYIKNHEHHLVSSIELAVNIESVKNAGIKFDERFGLGTRFPRGEEQIFLYDCRSAGLIWFFLSKYLVKHPYMSSGKMGKEKSSWFFCETLIESRIQKKIHFNSLISYLRRPKLFFDDYYKRKAIKYFNQEFK